MPNIVPLKPQNSSLSINMYNNLSSNGQTSLSNEGAKMAFERHVC